AVGESRERIRAALHAIGLALPPKRITVNLAPADLPKEGSHFDFPIALALLAALEVVSADFVSRFVVLGELSLDGTLGPIAGILPAAISAGGLGKGLICPAPCGPEAAWAGDALEILAPVSILALVNHVKGTSTLTRPTPGKPAALTGKRPDFSDIRGQEQARRALEVAAAGGHNLLMIGPPGAGKSMLAERLAGILPPLNPREMLEVSMVRSIAGGLENGAVSPTRPFRNPHHSASMAAMIGGGLRVRPGEVSLAHKGVLFLDELPEFSSQVLDSLRQPLESGEAVIARANHHVTYPARFQLIAAMNPCKCGRAGEPGFTCARGAGCASRYQGRISGPLMDRIDMVIEVPAISVGDLMAPKAAAEASDQIAARVAVARQCQAARHSQMERTAGQQAGHCNAELATDEIEFVAALDEASRALLSQAAQAMNLSARGYFRVLRVSRTLADLDGSPRVERRHVGEALAYRRPQRYELAA
ncbi:MAG: YifB family Mg chelatase-like AAA ATPase, partial [Alphaproteobacteria bacterium]